MCNMGGVRAGAGKPLEMGTDEMKCALWFLFCLQSFVPVMSLL